MTFDWIEANDEQNRPMWMTAAGSNILAIRHCGPNGRQFALRLNGVVTGIYPHHSDAKVAAAQIIELQEIVNETA